MRRFYSTSVTDSSAEIPDADTRAVDIVTDTYRGKSRRNKRRASNTI